MESSTLTNLLWIGGTIVVVGAFFYFKKNINDGKDEKGKTGNPKQPPVTLLPPVISQSPLPSNPIKAKKAFTAHLNDFAKLLPTLLKGFDINAWTGAIVSVDDPDLMGLWKKYVDLEETPAKWMQLLASWQVKCDTCKSFTCATNDNLFAYGLPDGSELTMNTKYKVISPCWVHTYEDAQGKVKKNVVTRGIVVPLGD